MAETNEPVSSEFFDLPLEMQEEILRQVPPRRLPAISQAGQNLYQATFRSYLERLCAESISRTEINRYTLTQPLLVGNHFCFREFENVINCDTEIYIRRNTDSYNSIRLLTQIEFNRSVSFQLTNEIKPSDLLIDELSAATMSEFDLLTEYRIRLNRLGCISRQPNYAKNQVIQILDTNYQAPIQGLEDDIWTYLYLWMNAYCFNVYPPPRNDIFFPQRPVEELLEILNKEIVRLYLAIRHELVKLD